MKQFLGRICHGRIAPLFRWLLDKNKNIAYELGSLAV